MTASAKFKAYACLILILLLLSNLQLFASALDTPPLISSVFTKPVATKTTESGIDTYHIYLITYGTGYQGEANITYLYDMVFTCASGTTVNAYAGSVSYSGIVATSPINGTYTRYIAETGELKDQGTLKYWNDQNLNGTTYKVYSPRGNYFPGGSIPMHFFLTDGMGYEWPTFIVDDWVNWAIVPPSVHIYQSYFSEPVSDEYNRYLIVGDGENASLLWFSFQEFEYQYINSGNPTNHIDGQIWSQTITLASSSGLNYSMLYQTPSALDDISYLQYALLITKFDLFTGQYQNSQLYANTTVSQNINIDLSGFFDPTEITDLCVYGMSCFISDYFVNRIAVDWSFDPSFLSWKESVISYLQLIYQSLSQTAEDVTIAQDESGYDEMQSAVNDLKVTDSNGSTVNAADQASVAFSQADAGIQDLAEPIGFINDNIVSNVFFEPILVVPVVVALALGLLITILGKNKSD